MNGNEKTIRVSVSEAARLLGVSSESIREAIRNQQVRYIVVRNRYKIHFGSLLEWSHTSVRRSKKLARDGIGQYVDIWKMSAAKFSPRPPKPN